MCLFADSSRLSVDEIPPPPSFFLFFFLSQNNSQFIFAPFSSSGAGSKTKALSGLGLIPVPKCFTANVITSPQVPRFRAPCLFPVVVFRFQVSFCCHPLAPTPLPWGSAILRILVLFGNNFHTRQKNKTPATTEIYFSFEELQLFAENGPFRSTSCHL